ncbi:MAG: hypothetical protein U9R08_04730 [Nanoarchaeota archaeon]|nr:hypothetical protein [Nanoarchaeota archaeon]
MKKLIITITLILLIAITASAITEDFKIESLKDTISICQSSPDVADIITITNTGTIPSNYNLNLDGKAAEWTTLSEPSFFLEQGKSKDIYVYIRSNPETEGKFNLDIDVQTDFNLKKSFQKEINIKRCQNLQIFPRIWNYDVAPCSVLTYEFDIHNTGEYVETYNIQTSNKWAELSHNPAIIEPHQSQRVFVSVKPPCKIYGNQDFMVTVEAVKSHFTANIPMKLNIQQLYNFSIFSEEEFNICTDTDTQLPITLSNKANLQNAYKLSLKAPSWIKLETKYPVLDAKQSATINLNATAKKEDDFNITIRAESLLGDLYLEKDITIKSKKCHELDLILPGDKDTICAQSIKRYKFELQNIGENKETINLELDAPEWVSISDDSVTIEPNTTKKVMLILNPETNSTGKHDIKVSASIQGSNLKKTGQMQVQIITGKQCSAFNIESLRTIQINNSNQTILIPVENRGAIAETYTISIDSPEFITLNSNTLKLDPAEKGFIELKTNPDQNQGTYEVLIQASTSEQAYSEVIKIKIGESQALEFIKIYLLYIIMGLGIILIINGILKLKELKNN